MPIPCSTISTFIILFLILSSSALAEPSNKSINEMVLVKGGCFQMGDTFGDGDEDEKPLHKVCVDTFEMDKTEVTQSAYEKVMGDNPSRFKMANNPVERVLWDEAKSYCEKLGKRLPTEAEWAFAVNNGDKKLKYAGGSDLDSVAWHVLISDTKTHAVAEKKPNSLGLFDMTGNVWEWASDWYDEDYYQYSPEKNPQGPSSGIFRVLRGGAWGSDAERSRASNRLWYGPDKRRNYIGFRCAQTP